VSIGELGDGSLGSREAEGGGDEGFLNRPKRQVPRFTCNLGGSGIVDCEGNSGTPVTAIRVVRIHLIDGDEVYQYIYRQERWDKSALTRCPPQSTPLTATFAPQPPLTRPLEATTPLDLAFEGPRYPRQVDLNN
jgi:hypothetical protein